MLDGPDGMLLAWVHTTESEVLQQEAPRLGITVRAIMGGIASVEIPAAVLPQLASMPGVVSIQPVSSYQPANDISTEEVGADATAAAYQGTGQGVIVAVIDSGLDFRHQDFRNTDGTSRVLAAWDQTDAGGAGAGCDAGITFGRCWSQADLDADLAGGPVAGLFDGQGHGTHVTGIAAGNGRGTANGIPEGTYAGVATEADLLVVKVFNSQGVWTNGDVPAALEWIDDQAAAAGKPVVVNLSIVRNLGPHDGTRSDEMAIDAFLAPGLTGRAVSIAAGNSRDAGTHATGTVLAGGTAVNAFTIPAYTPTAGSSNDSLWFSLWYEGGDNLTVSVLDSSNMTLATAVRGARTSLCTASGSVTIDARNDVDPENLDSEVLIIISDSIACMPVIPPPSNQTLSIRVDGVAVPMGGAYHIWSESRLGSGAVARFDVPEESSTVTMPATSARGISVGAYWTRHCFPNADPGTGTTCVTCPPPNGGMACPPIGAIADASGEGPTRDGRLKPEAAAPYATHSSLSTAAPVPPLQVLSPDGLHFAYGGTSMAAPHVAGALAVLFQFNPTLDTSQAPMMLFDGARVDSFTGTVPNQRSGYGKLGALASSEALLKLIDDLSSDANGDFSWTPEIHSTSYNVYRIDMLMSTPPTYGTCLESGLLLPSFSDPQEPSPDDIFGYLVTGTKNNIEGSLGFDSALGLRPNLSPCP